MGILGRVGQGSRGTAESRLSPLSSVGSDRGGSVRVSKLASMVLFWRLRKEGAQECKKGKSRMMWERKAPKQRCRKEGGKEGGEVERAERAERTERGESSFYGSSFTVSRLQVSFLALEMHRRAMIYFQSRCDRVTRSEL